MGLLSDAPAPLATRGGEGRKFIDLYRSMEPDDQALLRRWVDDDQLSTSEIYRRLSRAFDIGHSSVERGIQRLKAAQWEC